MLKCRRLRRPTARCGSRWGIRFANKKELIEKFANKAEFKSADYPISYFMAGSPGAGKTEFSKEFIKFYTEEAIKEDLEYRIVRIDADDIRDMLPYYNGSNSHLFQGAVTLGVNQLYDYVLKNKISTLVDGTFSSERYAIGNIERSIKRNRAVHIFYIYQDPMLAWKFTKAREAKEGRHISMNVFVDKFFKARDNVNKVKDIFGDKIRVDIFQKDYKHGNKKVWQKINKNIDNYINIEYTNKTLLDKLKQIDICDY